MRTRINFTFPQRELGEKKERRPKCNLTMWYVVTKRKTLPRDSQRKIFHFRSKPRLSCQSRSRNDELQRYYITLNKVTRCYRKSICKATSDGAKLTADTQITSLWKPRLRYMRPNNPTEQI
ncbi:hypothetical protein CDAR_36471 [Caerostris darwini]|uniref:Uncharacterized protein n=1 Tax=Caerostris darwini TaxID=1538125 RepID=A0AAV4M746_9ARAC|nr:hypothetical protein CDAR_36471 [Caerostris darwini]